MIKINCCERKNMKISMKEKRSAYLAMLYIYIWSEFGIYKNINRTHCVSRPLLPLDWFIWILSSWWIDKKECNFF